MIQAKLSSASNDPSRCIWFCEQRLRLAVVQRDADDDTVRVVDDADVGRLGGRGPRRRLALEKAARRRRAPPHGVVEHAVDPEVFVRRDPHGRHRADVGSIAGLLCEQRRIQESAENDSEEKPGSGHVDS